MVRAQLDRRISRLNTHCMAHIFLTFDFGRNEETAQLARHKVEGWKQGYRLGKKLELKFDRKESEAGAAPASEPAPSPSKAAAKSKGKKHGAAKTTGKSAKLATDPDPQTAPPPEIRILVRLDFSDHEKLSRQRWLERIPVEEPFKSAKSTVVRPGDPEFPATSDLYDTLG
jgi:hypothetical protein